MSRAQSAQGCILLGAATGKKKPNPKVRFSLLVVERSVSNTNLTLITNGRNAWIIQNLIQIRSKNP